MMANTNHTSNVTPAGAKPRAGVHPVAAKSRGGPRSYWVYILASKPGGTLYVGVTSDRIRRVHQHKTGEGAAFTRKYGVYLLVYAEEHHDVEQAIAQEKRLKKWRRAWKLQLIQEHYRDWTDLYDMFAS
jgi:putative endonuclease